MTDDAYEKFAEGRTSEEIEEQEAADDRDASVWAVTSVQTALVVMRGRLGMTQEALARKLGVSVITVCRWERRRSPSGLSLQKLAHYAREVGDAEAARVFETALRAESWPQKTWKGREVMTEQAHAPFFSVTDITTKRLVWVKVDAVAAVADGLVYLVGGQTLLVNEDEDAIMTSLENQYLTYEEILARKAE